MRPYTTPIGDGKGNTVSKPSADMVALHKAGWRIWSIRRRGMLKVILWIDPLAEGPAEAVPQGYAIEQLRLRKMAAAKGWTA